MMTGISRLEITDRAQPTNWANRVAAHIRAMPPCEWTPEQDLALMEAVMAGKFGEFTEHDSAHRQYVARQRIWQMQDAIRDDHGRLSLDGRLVLIEALRARVHHA